MNLRGWGAVAGAAGALALVALASNVTTTSQMEGDANTLLAARMTVSRLINAGALWAGLGVLSGWLVRRPVPAAAAGIVSLLIACLVHYGVGRAVGMFDASVFADNREWFLAALILGGPLGLIGAVARRTDGWGVAARLVVPAGAVIQPFYLGWFTPLAILPWPSRFADIACGSVLFVAGVAGALRVLVAARADSTRVPAPTDRSATGPGDGAATA
ncbi:hypothetical protein [Actinoplanes sp. NBRC 101535]|uniref:hypothetical protein n=1 Tax=Actinoplanes sp. NBRC 101535 TaxID=3032196 RepID=UPI0024A172C9|nr:hypothetical protein [Actinoplanes sp. NBRC 101535]GLY04439.1 hypothetical protein Acsp01_48180 [Actinoplanes sp. NBRC 101535]